MALPVVAIVGRPNVGKSSLFNWLAGKRIAIVDPTAGVTRDRVSSPLALDGRHVELVDTGGIGIEDVDNLTGEIDKQIQTAIDQAALLLFVVDARAGVVPLDEEVAGRLRSARKPVLLVANKCDTPELEPHALDFYRLGLDPVVPVSAHQNRGRHRLLRLIDERLPPDDSGETPGEVALKVAIVGRRNTGKSTFINCLAQSERMIVSEIPGTTRDSVDVRFQRDGKTFIAIDTAGVRRKGSVQDDVEFYSLARAERSIRRADVVLLFFDAQLKVSKVDKQLAEYILEQHKPAVFVVNKWDLMTPMPTGKMADYLHGTFPSLDFVPLAFITAKSGKNVHAVLNLAQNLHKQAGARVSTGDLNRVLRQALDATPPPLRQNRRPKVFYATQVDVYPPTLVLFTNGPELFDNTYRRYLLKTFRDQLPFHDVPIKLYLRSKQRPGKEAEEIPEAERETRSRPRSRRKGAPKPELWSDV
jgi:GTP-binding protein